MSHLIEQALFASSPKNKCELVCAATQSKLHLDDISTEPKPLLEPSYAGFLKIKHPTRIRRPKELSSKAALAKTLHQVAHIEYSAIDLALDSCYRFAHIGGEQYAKEWLKVAHEEVEHFSAIESALNELGFKYGDFAVHARLFEASVATQSSLKVRMGVVHRWLEACGLDANPFVAKKILASSYAPKNLLEPLLKRIMDDEITHVNAGHRYYLAAGGSTGQSFAALLAEYSKLLGKINVLNTPAREQAGYEIGECELIKSYLSKDENVIYQS